MSASGLYAILIYGSVTKLWEGLKLFTWKIFDELVIPITTDI